MTARSLLHWMLFLAMLVASPSLAQRHVNHARGFEPEKVYLAGEIDAVNPFNGNLTITLPIGNEYPVSPRISYQLSLTYNANLWEFEEVGHDTDNDNIEETWGVAAYPDRRANAGLGWSLSLGRLFPPDDVTTDSPYWIYESPDGGEHTFHPSDAAVQYTRDNSRLRLRRIDVSTVLIDFPDGTVHTFRPPPTSGAWRLTQIRDPFLDGSGNPINFVRVAYLDAADGFATKWTVTDSHGRTHYVHFGRMTYDGTAKPVVDRVQLTAFGSTTAAPRWAEYSFDYVSDAATRPCEDTDPLAYGGTPASATVPYLLTVLAPDGSSHGFSYARGSGACTGWNGLITSAVFPTKGKIAWSYGWYRLPKYSAAESYLQMALGVTSRTLHSETGAVVGYTSYAPVLDQPWNNETERPIELRNMVERRTSASGELLAKSIHYYSVATETNSYGAEVRDYGMPYTKKVASGALYLSTRTFALSGAALRSEYVTYEWDGIDQSQRDNRRLRNTRTIFHDDGNRRVDVVRDDYDGFGHYRKEVSSSTLVSSPARTSVANFNPGTDRLGIRNGSLAIAPNEPWILNTFDKQTLTAVVAHGCARRERVGWLRTMCSFCMNPMLLEM